MWSTAPRRVDAIPDTPDIKAKNHMIIMPDADMDQAMDALVGAGYGSAGERCMALSVAVPTGRRTADALMVTLRPRVESPKVGPSTDPTADLGPFVTRAHREKVRSYVGFDIPDLRSRCRSPILNRHGPDAVRFDTKSKTVTSCWPSEFKDVRSSSSR
jgi:delta 1-pyrroline-5-carboxylate dehydrogenase